MKKWKILPQMAFKGITANGMVYYPYIVAGVFSVFVFFVFSSIQYNDLAHELPYAPYAIVFMVIGKVLLFIILWLFLFYAGSFINKRRKKELGLYNLLGLEKVHIGIMLFLENIMLYVVITAGGILFGTVLARLLFMILLKISSLPLDVEFTFSLQPFVDTLVCFGVIFLINCICQLWEIGRARGTQLLAAGQKGEKEPRLLPIWALAGCVILAAGYAAAIRARADSMLFINFFKAVFLVVIGTYFIFTSGTVLFFKLLRQNKKLYYKADNFITISGMFYRMKKNAAGLSNICIFSTMTLITLICTFVVGFGMEEVSDYLHPYDVIAEFNEDSLYAEYAQEKLLTLEKNHDVNVQRVDVYDSLSLKCSKEENCFGLAQTGYDAQNYTVILMTLAEYEKLTDSQETLDREEILLYTNGVDFNYKSLDFMGVKADIKKEVQKLYPYPKFEQDKDPSTYVIVVRDIACRDEFVGAWAERNGVEDMASFLRSGRQRVSVSLAGDEDEREAFIADFVKWCETQPGFAAGHDSLYARRDEYSMYGSLLFIGVIFGLVFFLCLIIIMYYKQISEGYEDQGGFSIMKKVGMGEDEIKNTIHKQILCVFGLPLVGAMAHTAVGMVMLNKLMGTFYFLNKDLMIKCTVGTTAVFTVVYAIAYLMTARRYYRIVDR
ncbi:MAG: FtsX-like permease family protein [Roseburia sp.]|nr:FtsX-like permease family protein [Roseburia sp.]